MSEPPDYGAEYGAAETVWNSFTGAHPDAADDPYIQQYFNEMFPAYKADQHTWQEAHAIYNEFAEYVQWRYGDDIDLYFDWEAWAAHYKEAA
jgi:hypothetical protein